jgi:adenylate cyclase
VQVTILFSDIVGFTEIAGASATEDLISMLNRMFTAFDALVDKHGVYKVGITAL